MSFSDNLVSAGKKSLKYIRRSKKGNIRRKRNKLWFDEKCYSLRKEICSLCRALWRYLFNNEIRKFYQKVNDTKN